MHERIFMAPNCLFLCKRFFFLNYKIHFSYKCLKEIREIYFQLGEGVIDS